MNHHEQHINYYYEPNLTLVVEKKRSILKGEYRATSPLFRENYSPFLRAPKC